jgi:ketosteroid isomerase-like protein
MSANLDLVRSIYAAWQRGDWRSADWADADNEFAINGGPDPFRVTGVAATAKRWREVLGVFADFRAEGEEYRELDDQRVLVLHNWSGHGKTSALSVEQMQAKSATLFHVRDGKVTRLVAYWDRDRALADLGLGSEGEA